MKYTKYYLFGLCLAGTLLATISGQATAGDLGTQAIETVGRDMNFGAANMGTRGELIKVGQRPTSRPGPMEILEWGAE